MASTLLGQWQVINSSGNTQTFLANVTMAMIQAAVNIQSELSSTTNHTNRANYARDVLNNPVQFAPLFAYACASQGNDSSTIDATILNTVSAVWNALAGTI